jgi:hypothetical protein
VISMENRRRETQWQSKIVELKLTGRERGGDSRVANEGAEESEALTGTAVLLEAF